MDRLKDLVARVDCILDAVAVAPATDVPTRDRNDAFLCAAYGRAHRCMRSIRDLAEREEADDAFVLTRALVSLVAVSLWLVKPDDAAEREERFDSWRRSWVENTAKALEYERSLGHEPNLDPDHIRTIANDLKERGVAQLPPERNLLADRNLEAMYAKVYRPASDVAHFSLGAALDTLVEHPDRASGQGGVVHLDTPDRERAIEALQNAAFTYGSFLAGCKTIIPHGVHRLAASELNAYVTEQTTTPVGDGISPTGSP